MRFVSCLLFSLLFVQCTDKQLQNGPYQFDEIQQVSVQNMNYPDILGIGMQIVLVDSLVIINDFHGDSLLNVYDTKHHVIKRRLINKGNGPDDMLSPLDVSLCNDKLYILSRPLFKFSYCLKDSILEKNNRLYGHTQLPQLSDRFLPLNDSLFVFSGMWEKRYALYHKGVSDSLRVFGNYPLYWDEEKDIPNMARAMFHQCQLAKHPSKDLFATASSYVLDIYSYDPTGKELPTLLFRKQLGKYQYSFTAGNIVSVNANKDSDPKVKGICCTEHYIYMLREAKHRGNKTDIWVLDWDGNAVKLIEADKEIETISVDETGQRVYCLVQDPECILCSFNLE